MNKFIFDIDKDTQELGVGIGDSFVVSVSDCKNFGDTGRTMWIMLFLLCWLNNSDKQTFLDGLYKAAVAVEKSIKEKENKQNG